MLSEPDDVTAAAISDSSSAALPRSCVMSYIHLGSSAAACYLSSLYLACGQSLLQSCLRLVMCPHCVPLSSSQSPRDRSVTGDAAVPHQILILLHNGTRQRKDNQFGKCGDDPVLNICLCFASMLDNLVRLSGLLSL